MSEFSLEDIKIFSDSILMDDMIYPEYTKVRDLKYIYKTNGNDIFEYKVMGVEYIKTKDDMPSYTEFKVRDIKKGVVLTLTTDNDGYLYYDKHKLIILLWSNLHNQNNKKLDKEALKFALDKYPECML